MAGKKKTTSSSDKIKVETIIHEDATRKNIPTAEYQSIMQKNDQTSIKISIERRNFDIDPQLVWRGKFDNNEKELNVLAPPLYIQEKVHPKVLIDDLQSINKKQSEPEQISLFDNFNGLPNEGAKTEFYQHDSHWSNRMILGDSLLVMSSLAEREGLKGRIQCIFIDPPYGIKFNSNFQWSTTSKDVKDGRQDHITREPEQVKAFRDTWRDGIHSYLTYLRDRLTVARELLSDSGSVFVQIGDENVHRVRSLLEEVFGESNYVSTINFATTSGFTSSLLSREGDCILWFCKNPSNVKFRQLYRKRIAFQEDNLYKYVQLQDGSIRLITESERLAPDTLPEGARVFRVGDTSSQGASQSDPEFVFQGKSYKPSRGRHWTPGIGGLKRWELANRLASSGNYLTVKRYSDDNQLVKFTSYWSDTGTGSFTDAKVYVVQTNVKVIQRCVLMTTDPGDLVLDPTCGSGTTAVVCEQWGRRWITIDTSRVALALARARIMGARYPYYLLKDSLDGIKKEAEITGKSVDETSVRGNIRQGFVYERVPHVTLKSIAKNSNLEIIHQKWEDEITKSLTKLSNGLGRKVNEWEIPFEQDIVWSKATKDAHAEFWKIKLKRQKEIDLSISQGAEMEILYDKPYVDNQKVRVSGPFTFESISPHRSLEVDENENVVIDKKETSIDTDDFINLIIENLKTAGVQQSDKKAKINFLSIKSWPGRMIAAEGTYVEEESGKNRRAAIFIGPEFGTVSRPHLVEAAKEAGDADFDVLISCAFNYDARASDFQTLGRIPVLKARMNADLHMADDLKNTGKGNLFVIFGEPDIEIKKVGLNKVKVKINGVDVFNPNTGEVKSDSADGIACWFIDTDYNEESFFVRHAYFLGANDPYKSLKSSLKSEIDEEAWASLNSDTSRPFDIPSSGRIAVKVINHLGDEVMKVYKVE